MSADRQLLDVSMEVCVIQQHCQLPHHTVLVTNELIWDNDRMIQTATIKYSWKIPSQCHNVQYKSKTE